jgi:tRNA-splicing ligase RtcB (3'-phosphate/5'-hydroxy nucleic acid ligase)
MDGYRRDLTWAQEYAARNRAVVLGLLCAVVRAAVPHAKFDEPISCHHNYVAEESYGGVDVLVTRKGAIRAGTGELGIIPGSMGTGSYIVRGLGNADAYCSASHGAGRRMSRAAARKAYTAADLEEQTRGVECRKDTGVVDEIPAAYKDLDEVIRAQSDLVEVVAHLRQVVCVKG